MTSLRITRFLVVYFFVYANRLGVNCIPWPFGSWGQDSNDDWSGKWFPNSPGTLDNNEVTEYKSAEDVPDSLHGIQMGIPTYNCDDGKANLLQENTKTVQSDLFLFPNINAWYEGKNFDSKEESNLEVDWNNSPINYTCFDERRLYRPHIDINPEYSQEHIPAEYHAPHKCMSTSITYDIDVPTFGPHRPLWAKYGEYKFLPKQRWIHNLEHGAVVMLYHPCAWQPEVDKLKELVKSCLVRHVITPYTLLKPERPLALLTWGHRLLMSEVDPSLVVDFITVHAKHGPEQVYTDGQFSYGLRERAQIVSDESDAQLCPNLGQERVMS